MGAGLLLSGLTLAVPRLFEKPQFEAEAVLLIADRAPFIASSGDAGERDTNRYVRTQMALIRSSAVLEPVLSDAKFGAMEELKSADSPVEYLRERLAVVATGDSELYSVRYRGESPHSACAIVNAIVESYLTYNAMDDSQRTGAVVDILEDERLRRAVEIERLRRLLLTLSRDPEENLQPYHEGDEIEYGAGGYPTDLRTRVFDLDTEIAAVKGEVAFLKQAVRSKPNESVATAGDLEQRALLAAEQQLAGLVAKREFLSVQGIKSQKARSEDGREVQLEFARAALAREEKVFELIADRKLALQTEMRAPARVVRIQKAVAPKEALPTTTSGRMEVAAVIAFVLPFAVVGAVKSFSVPGPGEDLNTAGNESRRT